MTWSSGDAYEPYIGRWSRLVAAEFVARLGVAAGATWADVGCGTGALTSTVLDLAAPARIVGVDLSPAYVAYARGHVPHAAFVVGSATRLPLVTSSCDAVVSGLALNFVPQPAAAAGEMRRVARPGGKVAAYVWDYAGRMELLRYFFDVAGELDPHAGELDEGRRFPLCHPEPLAELFAGLHDVVVDDVTIDMTFRDFDDYWTPFLGGQGPAPAYVASLDAAARDRLRDALRERLPVRDDGTIPLVARAWSVRATKPHPAAG